MYQQITIKTLHKQGAKKNQIARELGCHRNTVRNVLQREMLIEKQTRVKVSIYTSYRIQIKEWMDKKISRLRIHELLYDQRLETLITELEYAFAKTTFRYDYWV